MRSRASSTDTVEVGTSHEVPPLNSIPSCSRSAASATMLANTIAADRMTTHPPQADKVEVVVAAQDLPDGVHAPTPAATGSCCLSPNSESLFAQPDRAIRFTTGRMK